MTTTRRRALHGALALPALLFAFGAALAAAHNPRGTAEATIAGKKISVSYGRPSLKGRDMLGQAQPGMVWRLGSEDATTLMTEGQLWFGDKSVEAGSYTLFAEKTEDGWTLLVNGQTGQSGMARDPEKDLFGVPLSVEEAAEPAEMFTISVVSAEDGMNGSLRMHWGSTALVAPLMMH